MSPGLVRVVCRTVLWFAPREFRHRFTRELETDVESCLEQGVPARSIVADVWCTVLAERRLQRTGWWTDLGGDLRYVTRGWHRSPGFTVTIVLTLAIGVGLTAAVFSFVDGYLFRPLPFPGADRVYMVRDPDAQIAGALKASDVTSLKATGVGRLGWVEWSLSGASQVELGGRSVEVLAYEVTEGFRQSLQLPLIAGRDFNPDDHAVDALPVAWVSWKFWRQALGGERSVVGRRLVTITPRGRREVELIGILAPTVSSFDATNRPPDLVVPARVEEKTSPMRLSFPLIALPNDMTTAQAQDAIGAALQAVAPSSAEKPRRVQLRSLREIQVRGGAPTARVFLIGAALIVLLAGLNLAHLLLCRSAARHTELRIRRSLGASRWRLVRLGVLESATLGGVGCALGLAVGYAIHTIIQSVVPDWPTAGRNLSLVPMVFDLRVIGVAAGLGMLVTLVGGLWPAVISARRASASTSSRTHSHVSNRVTRTLLASELSVAAVVLVGVSFIGIGIHRYLNQPLGFDYRDRTQIFVETADKDPIDDSKWAEFLLRVGQLPGVSAASSYRAGGARMIVRSEALELAANAVAVSLVPDGYLAAWGETLEAGRWFLPIEYRTDAAVALVSRHAAAALWPAGSAVGKVVTVGEKQYHVIGVTAPRRNALEREPGPAVMLPVRSVNARGFFVVWAPGRSADSVAPEVAAIAAGLSPDWQIVAKDVTFDEIFLRGAGEARFQTPVMATFGVLALTLAAVGVFGLVSYSVERRMREFGIRVAIGASRIDIWRGVAREALLPATVGLVVGATAAWWLERYVESAVFGWTSSGALAVVTVAAGLFLVSLSAILRPASRAAGVDPAVALRSE